jgi:hypothetical protein
MIAASLTPNEQCLQLSAIQDGNHHRTLFNVSWFQVIFWIEWVIVA